jgi:hypothetical protein
MLIVIFALTILLMASVLLAPEFVNDVMHRSVPKGLRPPASRLILVPVVVIFLFGTFMFDSVGPSVVNKTFPSGGPLQHPLFLMGGLTFLLFGGFACLWPWRFMRLCIPRLKLIDEHSVQEHEMKSLARVARGFGIIFLVGSSFLLRGWFR